MSRTIIAILLLLFYVSAEAQISNRNRRRQSLSRSVENNRPQQLPKFNAEKAVGITIYDLEKVPKKIGLKKSSENYKKVIGIFNVFNKEIKQVARINSFTLSEAKTSIEANQNLALKTKDFSALQKVYKEIDVKFQPIIKLVNEKEQSLDKDLEKVLSKKQFKKWEKYKLKLKRKD